MRFEEILNEHEIIDTISELPEIQIGDVNYITQYFWGKPDFGSYVPHTFVFYLPYSNDKTLPVFVFYRTATSRTSWQKYEISQQIAGVLRERLFEVCSYHYAPDEKKHRPPKNRAYWWNLMPFITYLQLISDNQTILEGDGNDKPYSITEWLKEPTNSIPLIVVQDSKGNNSLNMLGGFFTSYEVAYSWYCNQIEFPCDLQDVFGSCEDIVWCWNANSTEDLGDLLLNRIGEIAISSFRNGHWLSNWEELPQEKLLISRRYLSNYQTPKQILKQIKATHEEKQELIAAFDRYESATCFEDMYDHFDEEDYTEASGFHFPSYMSLSDFIEERLQENGILLIEDGNLKINILYHIKEILCNKRSLIPLQPWYLLEYFIQQLTTYSHYVSLQQISDDCFHLNEPSFETPNSEIPIELKLKNKSWQLKYNHQTVFLQDLQSINSNLFEMLYPN